MTQLEAQVIWLQAFSIALCTRFRPRGFIGVMQSFSTCMAMILVSWLALCVARRAEVNAHDSVDLALATSTTTTSLDADDGVPSTPPSTTSTTTIAGCFCQAANRGTGGGTLSNAYGKFPKTGLQKVDLSPCGSAPCDQCVNKGKPCCLPLADGKGPDVGKCSKLKEPEKQKCNCGGTIRYCANCADVSCSSGTHVAGYGCYVIN